jgi:hypothetical protein
MKTTLRALALIVLLLIAGLLLALASAIQSEPSVVLPESVDQNDVARVLALVRVHDPRHAIPGARRSLALSEHDLGVLLNHAAYRWLGGSTRVKLEDGSATVLSSLHLPANPFGRWLNVQAKLVQTGALPAIASLRFGGLPVPAWVGQRLAARLSARAGVQEELLLAADAVQQVRFFPQQLWLSYAWQGDSSDRMLGALLPVAEQQRLQVYAERLSALVAQDKPGAPVSLSRLLAPMFALVQQRGGGKDGDTAAENRAALIVLTLYVNGQGVDALLPAARAWPQPNFVQVTLGGRDDFPRHLLVSAALASEGTGPLSRAIGVYKEVADSRGGSGFSFNDIAADRAGTRLGELALAQPQRLAAALARSTQETDVMPAWADLPEFMPEPEFQRRYGGIGAPPYNAMLTEIDRRVAALPALR